MNSDFTTGICNNIEELKSSSFFCVFILILLYRLPYQKNHVFKNNKILQFVRNQKNPIFKNIIILYVLSKKFPFLKTSKLCKELKKLPEKTYFRKRSKAVQKPLELRKNFDNQIQGMLYKVRGKVRQSRHNYYMMRQRNTMIYTM